MLQHSLSVEIGNQKGNIVPLNQQRQRQTYQHRFPSQNDKIFSTSSEESCQLVCQDPFNIICLLDFDTNPYRVDGWLNEDLFILIAGYMHWIQDDL